MSHTAAELIEINGESCCPTCKQPIDAKYALCQSEDALKYHQIRDAEFIEQRDAMTVALDKQKVEIAALTQERDGLELKGRVAGLELALRVAKHFVSPQAVESIEAELAEVRPMLARAALAAGPRGE